MLRSLTFWKVPTMGPALELSTVAWSDDEPGMDAQAARDPMIERLKRLAQMSDPELDALPYGAVELDPVGLVIRYNRAYTQLSGWDGTAIGKNLFAQLAPHTNVPAFAGIPIRRWCGRGAGGPAPRHGALVDSQLRSGRPIPGRRFRDTASNRAADEPGLASASPRPPRGVPLGPSGFGGRRSDGQTESGNPVACGRFPGLTRRVPGRHRPGAGVDSRLTT